MEVAEYGDGAYLPGDVIDDRLAYWSYEGGVLTYSSAPARPAFPHSVAAAPSVAAAEGCDFIPAVAPAPGPGPGGSGSGVTPGGAR